MYNILLIIAIIFSIELSAQTDSSSKTNILFVGFEGLEGFGDVKNLMSLNNSEELMIKGGLVPKIGMSHRLKKNFLVTFDINYSFYTSSKLDTVISSEIKMYRYKKHGLGAGIDFDYYLLKKKHNYTGLLVGVQLNRLSSFSEFEVLKEASKLNVLRYKIGVVAYRLGASVRFFYSRFGDNNMLGAELRIALKSF
ncbi:MAG: hypothetical protein N4A35_14950 [Flavobacteriales bacterium]|jgi:hypothetical protein|nr:hypothetical protein [Flavobacteriales bacterium]